MNNFSHQTDLSRYNNVWYAKRIGASVFKRLIWYYFSLLFIKSRFLPISAVKPPMLRMFGASIGKGVVIKPAVHIKYPWLLKIGDYSWIGEGVWIDNLDQVSIGRNVCISQGALLLTGNHNFRKSTFDLIIKPVVLHDGVWIGAKSIVCPGVTGFSHSVLLVSSVANADMDEFSVYQGNPAQKIKDRVIAC